MALDFNKAFVIAFKFWTTPTALTCIVWKHWAEPEPEMFHKPEVKIRVGPEVDKKN